MNHRVPGVRAVLPGPAPQRHVALGQDLRETLTTLQLAGAAVDVSSGSTALPVTAERAGT